jgi:hypothetical protein
MSALIDLPLRTSYTDGSGNRVTRNLGTAPGAPATCTLGDGVTSTTFPTQVSPHGMSFDGGDYIDTGLIAQLEYNTPFSLSFVAETPTTAPCGVFGNVDGTESGVGLWMNTTSGQGYFRLRNGATQVAWAPAGAFKPGCIDCHTVTWNGADTMTWHRNGASIGTNVAAFALSVNTGRKYQIGRFYAHAVTQAWTKRIFRFAVYPYVLTPSQVGILHARYMRELQV